MIRGNKRSRSPEVLKPFASAMKTVLPAGCDFKKFLKFASTLLCGEMPYFYNEARPFYLQSSDDGCWFEFQKNLNHAKKIGFEIDIPSEKFDLWHSTVNTLRELTFTYCDHSCEAACDVCTCDCQRCGNRLSYISLVSQTLPQLKHQTGDILINFVHQWTIAVNQAPEIKPSRVPEHEYKWVSPTYFLVEIDRKKQQLTLAQMRKNHVSDMIQKINRKYGVCWTFMPSIHNPVRVPSSIPVRVPTPAVFLAALPPVACLEPSLSLEGK
jgi:hypothetical protein